VSNLSQPLDGAQPGKPIGIGIENGDQRPDHRYVSDVPSRRYSSDSQRAGT
jgi:hypothetical protein